MVCHFFGWKTPKSLVMRSMQAAFFQLNRVIPPMPDVSHGHLLDFFVLGVGSLWASEREKLQEVWPKPLIKLQSLLQEQYSSQNQDFRRCTDPERPIFKFVQPKLSGKFLKFPAWTYLLPFHKNPFKQNQIDA